MSNEIGATIGDLTQVVPVVPVAAADRASEVVVGGCRLGEKIGAGSFGEIFLAVDLQTGEKFAAKLVG